MGRSGEKERDGDVVCVDKHRVIGVAVCGDVEVGGREGRKRERCNGLRRRRRSGEEDGRERRVSMGRRVAVVSRFGRWGCVLRVGVVECVVGLIAALGVVKFAIWKVRSSDLF